MFSTDVECRLHCIYTAGYVHPLDQEEEFEIDSSEQETRMLFVVVVAVECVPNVCLMCAECVHRNHECCLLSL